MKYQRIEKVKSGNFLKEAAAIAIRLIITKNDCRTEGFNNETLAGKYLPTHKFTG